MSNPQKYRLLNHNNNDKEEKLEICFWIIIRTLIKYRYVKKQKDKKAKSDFNGRFI